MSNPSSVDLQTAGPGSLLPSGPAETPTNVRYVVLAFLAAMTFVLYLDRVYIGQSATDIKNELGISNAQMSWVINAFVLSYAIFEIPTGRWGDTLGSRRVLTRIVIWWSIFTILTGAATGFVMLLVVRFLFGAGEAGALPNSARVLREWFPESKRGRAQGIVTTFMMIGGATTPILAQWLIGYIGWRWTFGVFGLIGLIWALAFYWWFRDNPAEHPATNEAERSLILADGDQTRTSGGKNLAAHGPIPWEVVLRNPNIWLLGLAMITMSAIYMLMTYWYPTYLKEARGVPDLASGKLASLVLGAGAVGCCLGGWLTDFLTRKTGSRRWGRTAQCILGGILVVVGLLSSLFVDNATASACLVALACFGVQIQVPAWWASATQVSGKHLGALFGLMNMIGNIGGTIMQTCFSYLVDARKAQGFIGREQWDQGVLIYVMIAVIGIILWALIDPRNTVDKPLTTIDPELA